MNASSEEEQLSICEKYNSKVVPTSNESVLGLALETLKKVPIYGVRRQPATGSNGWYIWAGEYSDADDFFQPVHTSHLRTVLPVVRRYLSLEPGFKFIIDDKGYEDVWFDSSLLAPPRSGPG